MPVLHPTTLDAPAASDVLAALVADPAPPPFALLRREGGDVELLVGDPLDGVVDVATLADLPLPGPGELPLLALVPFRQVAELGFDHHDDGAPLRCLRPRLAVRLPVGVAADLLPHDDVPLAGAAFDVDDAAYARAVTRVIEEEIGRGEGANVVVRRDLLARQPLPPARAALAVARRLLLRETGAYWTFAVHLPGPGADLTAVGATPERHVSLRAGEAVMNPISGTYRHPDGVPTRAGLLDFLADTKEVEELFMVVDEELKMMSALCETGGRVSGPFLKPMSRLTHTEYLLTGRTAADPRAVLRATLFAATVTGSPLRNACSMITRHEPTGRGHYSGVAALLSHGPDGPELDAPILIRTAYLAADGGVRVPVGATLVRHSVPEREVAETHAKVAGLLSAFRASPAVLPVADPEVAADVADPEVAAALVARNAALAPFWLQEQDDHPDPALAGRTALVVDAEDAWTAMLAHALRRAGLRPRVAAWDGVTAADVEAADLLVAGPGPGDPRDAASPRISAVRALVTGRLASGRPLLAVCLSHQVLAGAIGLPVGPLPRPYQGTQREVEAFGRRLRVGFYNTFTARCTLPDGAPRGVRVFTGAPGEVVALRGPGFASVQFHLESVLSPDGTGLLRDLARDLLVEDGRPATC